MNLNKIRQLYSQAAADSQVCEQLHAMLDDIVDLEQHPVLLGYQGATQAIRAKHAFFPHLKLSRFWEATHIIKRAIIKDEKNVELRFLRFTIQTNSPALLGYKENIEEDKQLITAALPQLKDKGLVKAIATALLANNTSSQQDKELATKYLDN